MRLEDDDLSEYRGFNPAFVRHVWAKKKGWVAPQRSVYEFKPKLHRTWRFRQERKMLAGRAAAVHAETLQLKFNAEDAAKSAGAILVEVCEKHEVSKEEIRVDCRAVFLVAVKWQAIARIYLSHPEMSLVDIGTIMGGRDHTTILNAVRKMGIWRNPRAARQKRKP